MYIYATLCIGTCTALASCTHSRPHSFLQRRRARPAHECRMWELEAKLTGYCLDIFAENLCKIYNRSMENKCCPDALKLAKVIALYKKGPKYDMGNYHPISFLSYFDKIFKKLICKHLISFLDMHKIMYCHQLGFRKSHSTVLALIDFTYYIGRLLDERNYA